MYFSISVPRKQMDGRSLLCPFLDTPPKPRFAIGGVLVLPRRSGFGSQFINPLRYLTETK